MAKRSPKIKPAEEPVEVYTNNEEAAEGETEDDDGTVKGKTPEEIVAEARKRFSEAKDFYSTSRTLAVEDTQFVMGDSDNGYQWPKDIRQARITEQKICLTVNTTAQHCNQILNGIKQNRPQAKVSPADDFADKKTAEILEGLIRNIQAASNGDDAHDIGATHALYGGEGYWRIVTDYESPKSFNQVIKIKQCPNPQLVFIDPSCQELDKSDAEWGFVFEDISKEQAKRDHPDIEPASWAENDPAGWVQKDKIRRAEYFYCTYIPDHAYLLSNESIVLKSELEEGGLTIEMLPEEITVLDERPTMRKQWKWCKLVGGHDAPVDERDWKGSYLPIIAVIGVELNVNGEIIRKGLVRDLKDPARILNFAYSETVQTLALQNKIPYIAPAEAIQGYEQQWKNANKSNDSYLPYNGVDDEGNKIDKPERQQPAVMPNAQVQLLQLSTDLMRAGSGQQNANFGVKSEAQSGIGIQRLKVQGEVATFHFPDNLARSLRYEAKVLIDLIQQYYDTKRVVRILGLDGKESHATLDPAMQGAYAETQGETEKEVQRIFNPTVGQYDVTINTGPSFQTQRQEGFAMLSDIASRNPQLMQVAGDLIMRSADIPGSEEIADRLAKTLPPGLAGEEGDQTTKLTQELQKMQQQGQQYQQVIGKMQEHIDGLETKLQGKVIETEGKVRIATIQQQTDAAKGVAEHGVDTYEAETRRMAALVPTMTPDALRPLVAEVLRDILSAPPLGQQAQPNNQPAPAGFSLPEEQEMVADTPPEMAATGAQPGLGDEPTLPEGNPNVPQ